MKNRVRLATHHDIRKVHMVIKMAETNEVNFVANVKRKPTATGDDVWVARLEDGTEFTSNNERVVREEVRLHVLSKAAEKMQVNVNTLAAKLTRTWHIRVIPESDVVADDDGPIFSLFD